MGYTPGYSGANIDSVDITVHGVGGHGAYPHKTKDPVVLAAQIVLALQTIVSREVQPGEPVVVTVGTIHGGTRRNIIPDEVRLQLTVRSYKEEVRQQTLAAIKRIARGQALAAGMPEDRLPEVKVTDEITPALYNDPKLTETAGGRAQRLVRCDQPGPEAALDGRRGLLRVWPHGAEGPHLHDERRRRQSRGPQGKPADGQAVAFPPLPALGARAGADHQDRRHHARRLRAGVAREPRKLSARRRVALRQQACEATA